MENEVTPIERFLKKRFFEMTDLELKKILKYTCFCSGLFLAAFVFFVGRVSLDYSLISGVLCGLVLYALIPLCPSSPFDKIKSKFIAKHFSGRRP